MTTLYRVVGHNCDSEHPNTPVLRPTADGSTRGCEHVRIDSPLTEREAGRIAKLMRRMKFTVTITTEETP